MATDNDQIGGGNDQISYRILPGPYSVRFSFSFYDHIPMTQSDIYQIAT